MKLSLFFLLFLFISISFLTVKSVFGIESKKKSAGIRGKMLAKRDLKEKEYVLESDNKNISLSSLYFNQNDVFKLSFNPNFCFNACNDDNSNECNDDFDFTTSNIHQLKEAMLYGDSIFLTELTPRCLNEILSLSLDKMSERELIESKKFQNIYNIIYSKISIENHLRIIDILLDSFLSKNQKRLSILVKKSPDALLKYETYLDESNYWKSFYKEVNFFNPFSIYENPLKTDEYFKGFSNKISEFLHILGQKIFLFEEYSVNLTEIDNQEHNNIPYHFSISGTIPPVGFKMHFLVIKVSGFNYNRNAFEVNLQQILHDVFGHSYSHGNEDEIPDFSFLDLDSSVSIQNFPLKAKLLCFEDHENILSIFEKALRTFYYPERINRRLFRRAVHISSNNFVRICKKVLPKDFLFRINEKMNLVFITNFQKDNEKEIPYVIMI